MKQSPIHPHILQDQSEVDWCHGFLKYMDPPGKVTQLLIENHATYLPFYKKGPLTALASFPGSGNTWIRYLLQQATGIATGSVYNSTQFLKSCFPGEGVYNGSVIAIKTHVGR